MLPNQRRRKHDDSWLWQQGPQASPRSGAALCRPSMTVSAPYPKCNDDEDSGSTMLVARPLFVVGWRLCSVTWATGSVLILYYHGSHLSAIKEASCIILERRKGLSKTGSCSAI